MKRNLQLIKKYRRYSDAFKKKVVNEFESGSYSTKQLSIMYTIAPSLIYNWVYKFSIFNEKDCRIIEMKDSTEKKLKEQQKRIVELEQMLGRKQIQVEFMEKMLDLAKEEYGIDLKKNYSTPPLPGSTKTKKS